MEAALIAGTSNPGLASAVAARLQLELTPAEIGRHPDGEIRVRVSPALRGRILDVLGEIAPEADLSNFRSDVPIQEQLDIDSLDLLSLMTGIFERTKLEIPQADYQKVSTLDGCVEYISARQPGTR